MKAIPLGGKKAAGRVVLVDDEDYGLVMQYRWHLWESRREGRRTCGPYACTGFRRDGRVITLRMHTLITGWPETDHIDHDGLNNQRSNLRPATRSQNNANTRVRLADGKYSRYKGVTWYRSRRKWSATVGVDGTRRYLGLFASEEDAALAYNTAALEAFGEYAFLNEIAAGENAA